MPRGQEPPPAPTRSRPVHDEFNGIPHGPRVNRPAMIRRSAHARRYAGLCIALVLASADTQPAFAQDASNWDKGSYSSARLVAGARREGTAILRAGVEIRLAEGWKTYWRYPGDSGLPPRFDLAASDNVESVTVLWPAPQRFTDETGTSIGYRQDVVFPLHVTPKDRGKPVRLRLKLEYAVCEKLCVPAEAKTELLLSGRAGAHETLLARAEAAVPKAATLGESTAFAIRTVMKQAGAPHARIMVDIAAQPGAPLDLFAEGPTPDWALPLPKEIAGAPAGLRRFVFELDGMPPGIKPDGALLRLTATAPGKAIEVVTRLD